MMICIISVHRATKLTTFPYTTLFRSEGGNDLYPARQIHRDPDHYFGFPFVLQHSTMLIETQRYLNALLRDFYIAGGKDRKSTRMKSSHIVISYCVFFLKINCTTLWHQ